MDFLWHLSVALLLVCGKGKDDDEKEKAVRILFSTLNLWLASFFLILNKVIFHHVFGPVGFSQGFHNIHCAFHLMNKVKGGKSHRYSGLLHVRNRSLVEMPMMKIAEWGLADQADIFKIRG